jgi:Bacterial regulatory proteins, luxR family
VVTARGGVQFPDLSDSISLGRPRRGNADDSSGLNRRSAARSSVSWPLARSRARGSGGSLRALMRRAPEAVAWCIASSMSPCCSHHAAALRTVPPYRAAARGGPDDHVQMLPRAAVGRDVAPPNGTKEALQQGGHCRAYVGEDSEFHLGHLDAVERLLEPLTERELEVLQLLAAGRPNRQIAQELVITLETVKSTSATSSTSSRRPTEPTPSPTPAHFQPGASRTASR